MRVRVSIAHLRTGRPTGARKRRAAARDDMSNRLTTAAATVAAVRIPGLSTRRRRRSPAVAQIAVNMRPVDVPWGGGNWFLRQLIAHLERSGYELHFDLERGVDCILALDPRLGGKITFAAA